MPSTIQVNCFNCRAVAVSGKCAANATPVIDSIGAAHIVRMRMPVVSDTATSVSTGPAAIINANRRACRALPCEAGSSLPFPRRTGLAKRKRTTAPPVIEARGVARAYRRWELAPGLEGAAAEWRETTRLGALNAAYAEELLRLQRSEFAAAAVPVAAPTMPEEELYDLQSDPFEIHNLAKSNQPEHRRALERLSEVLTAWITQTNDQGRIPEPEEVAKNEGGTKGPPSEKKGKGKEMEKKEKKSPKLTNLLSDVCISPHSQLQLIKVNSAQRPKANFSCCVINMRVSSQ